MVIKLGGNRVYSKQNLNIVLMKKIQNEMSKKINTALKKRELTMPQAELLAELMESEQNKMTLKELEKSLHLSQPVTSEIVTRLENKGYVETFGNEQDKRIKVVKITKLGQRQAKVAGKYIENVERKMLFCLTKNERKNFDELLQKVWETLE